MAGSWEPIGDITAPRNSQSLSLKQSSWDFFDPFIRLYTKEDHLKSTLSAFINDTYSTILYNGYTLTKFTQMTDVIVKKQHIYFLYMNLGTTKNS